MQEQILMPSKLNPGMISVLRVRYDILTDEVIQRVLVKLYNDHLINPEYLFVGYKGRKEITHILETLPERVLFVGRPVEDWNWQYLNKSTGKMMHVVILPTLPDNILLFGNLSLPDWGKNSLWGEDEQSNK